jgi:hypothetical protein
MKMKNLSLVIMSILFLAGCNQSPFKSVGSVSGETDQSLDSTTSDGLVSQHLAVAVKSDGTDDTAPADASSAENKGHGPKVQRIVRFLHKPENAAAVKEMHTYLETNNPALLPATRPGTRAEAIAELIAIVDYLDQNRASLSPEAQALLDRADKFKARVEAPDDQG